MAHPLALAKLGLFMRDAFAQHTGRPPPVVLVGPPDAPGPAGTCSVLGLTDTPMRAANQVR